MRVAYSTLNYKDGLAITGKRAGRAQLPDGAGHRPAPAPCEATSTPTGSRATASSSTAGASARPTGAAWRRGRALKGDWLVPLPASFTPRQAMAIGTAGYTAMLCVMALERARRHARQGRGARHRRGRRRRQHGGRAAAAPRLHRRRVDRPARRRPTTCASLGAAEIVDRAELHGAGQAAAEGALGRRRRRGRQPHPRQRAARRRATAASSPPAAWPRAWTCRRPWRPSSCAA